LCVSIVTELHSWAGRPRFRGWIPSRSKKFLPSTQHHTQ